MLRCRCVRWRCCIASSAARLRVCGVLPRPVPLCVLLCPALSCLGRGAVAAGGRGLRWPPLWLGGGAEEWGAHFRGGPCFWQGVGSRWPPRLRCRGGGHPVRSPRGSMRTGRVGWSMLWGSNPDARDGAPPFEGGASTCSAKHRGSPCLLVKGADCAGVCLAVLAWLCPGLSRDPRSRVALFSCVPALSEAGVRV